MRSVKVIALALATTLATTFAGQAASENVLRWASAGGVQAVDPHAYDDLQTAAQYRQT
jgi:hypothetical protein